MKDYLPITVSIDVTVFRKEDSVKTIIARGDKVLYKAKKKTEKIACRL